MPAGCHQTADGRSDGGSLVEVKWLRIELRGEGDNLAPRDMAPAKRQDFAGNEIFEVTFRHGVKFRT
jgi:hypothetical protein